MWYHNSKQTRPGFTIVELLVVISIILILAGLLLPVMTRGREEARTTECLNNLRQIGIALNIYAQHYGDGRPDGYPPWLTMLTTRVGTRQYLSEPSILICPSDGGGGAEGGRPDRMRNVGGEIIKQFPMADVDEHTGPLNGSGPENDSDGGANCSYLFEMCGEPCDWIYGGHSPPIAPGTNGGVPSSWEWQWSGSQPANFAEFRTLADRDRNGMLSWNEVKVLSRRGYDEEEMKLKPWHIRVPVLRCYWHVEGQDVLKDDSSVVNLRSDGSADRGMLKWYE